MGLFDAIEKLINEHGSATILREHLGFIKAKHAALEGKAADLERQIAAHKKREAEQDEQLRMLQNQLDALEVDKEGHDSTPLLRSKVAPILFAVVNPSQT